MYCDDHSLLQIKNKETQDKWNHHCLFSARRETGFMLWLLESMELTQHLWCWAVGGPRVQRAPVPVDCTRLGPLLSNGPITIVFPPTEPGWSQFCLEQPCWFACNFFVLWSSCGLVQIQAILWATKNPFSGDSWGLEFDGWTSFFTLWFIIAASGLRKDCWVCLHFNKYSIKMLWCVDGLASW